MGETQVSTALNRAAREYSRRLAIRRRMLDHLGLAFSEAATTACFDDLRETVLSCAHCADPGMCETWLDQGHRGVPEFCTGRSAFLALCASLERDAVQASGVRSMALHG